jgi:hypothetical protein
MISIWTYRGSDLKIINFHISFELFFLCISVFSIIMSMKIFDVELNKFCFEWIGNIMFIEIICVKLFMLNLTYNLSSIDYDYSCGIFYKLDT